ncbi:Transcriptional activator%2C adenine-specific DNA methyltransferase [uncultured Roseburia sp.]|uniref:MT-A70 family methyltransferase n=1 Tax=Brotonthovivens ammoniilytica TaxID=2981725 RepID=A0ABT2TIA7_9FIRM|nr:MT-A70 family methyltransferase [Brotonthovivens ammoniilytica]MCU6761938.1 MT-A70 family methyltransferase [Brotonthovivens ammoniilytica]SCI51097.1 Transcriptional activator%2C adenine-specific DNA methyltransferase [uncultured Roseburia sp.]
MEQKKYSIIYADPPWRYEMKKGQGVAENHYSTMGIEEICSLPVQEICEKDCVLFLWVTFPQLPEAFKVIKAWGFCYKTVAFVWIKQNKSGNGYFFGLGYWTRSNAEICLLAVKGKPKRVSKKVFQLIVSPLQEHSRKPAEARERIVELMGDLPRIELFARQQSPGWDVWGNEVKSSLDMEHAGRCSCGTEEI